LMFGQKKRENQQLMAAIFLIYDHAFLRKAQNGMKPVALRNKFLYN